MPRITALFAAGSGEIIEPLLLFTVFFLPGYLFQGAGVDPTIFDNPVFHLLYLVQTLPLILLLLYLLARKGRRWWVPYRITTFAPSDLRRGVLTALGIWAALLPFFLLVSLLFPQLADEAAGVPWRLTRVPLLPLVALTCLATGYWEELFFRAYLDGQFRRLGVSPAPAAAAGTLLFAAGHLYQGPLPAVGTALIGGVLLYSFRRTRSIHGVAIGHALYNFSVLSLSLATNLG